MKTFKGLMKFIYLHLFWVEIEKMGNIFTFS